MKSRNIFSSMLSLLNVKHTVSFANKYYNEHPHKYNLFGLSKMLSDYGIENVGIRVNEKRNDLSLLEAPYVAQVSNELVVVEKVDANHVTYLWNEKKIILTQEEFINIWSGVVLVAEPDKNSIEPDYNQNRKKELFNYGQQWLLFSAGCIAVILSCIINHVFNNFGLLLSLLINLTGVYIGCLLIMKQMHIQSNYADRICSLFKQNDCNNVLESEAAKFMGVIGWSEVGLGYFISNLIVILYLPHLIPYLALINICSLPYTIWSVWYQKVKVGQWCPLCLIVQVLLWCIFAINMFFGYIKFPEMSSMDIVSAGCVYLIPFLTISLLLPLLAKGNRMEQITQEINSLKSTDEVFLALLKKQIRYEVSKSTSNILLGNPDSENLITIFTNPHCEPCGKMHARVENLLNDTKDKFCIQYIFSSFNEELDSSSDFLIHTYLNNSYDKAIIIYHEWFKDGKYNKEDFFKKYELGQFQKGQEHYIGFAE